MVGRIASNNTLKDETSSGFSGEKTVEQLNQSMNGMLLLHASCQGLIEAEIKEVASTWYAKLEAELGKAEMLVIHWRQNGFLYFQQHILDEVVSLAQLFLTVQSDLNPLFNDLENSFSESTKEQVSSKLSSLQASMEKMNQEIDAYQAKLLKFQNDMQVPHNGMNRIIAQVQEEEQEIQAEIQLINSQIKDLQKQLKADRKAIAKAKKVRTRGTIETIFGVLLAPVTGGASLILLGIGVASIVEAESKISSMKTQIGKYQGQIVDDQGDLSGDQKTVATLNGLSMNTGIVIDDMNLITGALDALKLTWALMSDELMGVIAKLESAKNSQEFIVYKAWFAAACNEWNVILEQAQNLKQQNAPSPNRETIG